MDLREQLQASLGDVYALERELPAGGMSRVFVAVDAALHRRIVVKVMAADAAAQVSIDRFKREIAFVAGLQHPHIVPLLTAGESDGLPYFTMPFVEGESLRARLERAGELPVPEAVRILREIASALAYAHECGVVHRDIKPDNVLLSPGGIAMVADFGVAKALAVAQRAPLGESRERVSAKDLPTALTEAGIGLGTPAYMSPEQVAADSAIDHRADIYSFGVLAYEVLAGTPPFVGRTLQQVLAAHMNQIPVLLTARRPSLPPALDALVMQCLAKRPADRPQSAAEIVRALDELSMPGSGQPTASATRVAEADRRARTTPRRRVVVVAGVAFLAAAVIAVVALARRPRVAAPASAEPMSIAVLPFENRSGDTSFDYFAEGMSDDLRSDLTTLPGLAVKGASSSRRFSGHTVDVREAGGKLGAMTLVMGTVNRSGGHLHVTAELVNVANENAVWSRTFDTRTTDLAVIQDSITRAIAGELSVGLAARGLDGIRSTPIHGSTDIDAYDLFLQARYAEHRHQFARAIELYTAASARDSSFASAYAGLARAIAAQVQTGRGSRDSALAKARDAVARAAALDPSLPDVYRAHLVVEWLAGDFRAVGKWSERLVAASPGDAESHEPRSLALGLLGHPEQALVEVRKAELLDPLDPRTFMSLGYLLYNAGDFRGAIAATRRVFELGPSPANSVVAYEQVGSAQVFAGAPDSAVATFERAMETDSTVYGVRAYLVFAYAAAGRWQEARAQRALVEREEKGGNSPNFLRVIIHETFGANDSAVVDMMRAAQAVEPLYTFNDVGCDPMFDPLKADRRFTALMANKGITPCPPRGRWPIGKQR